jgi:Fe-Mn family superoxide dismutase
MNIAYAPKNFEHLLRIEGFSEQLLRNHFTLYQGYVTNVNKLADTLSNFLREGKAGPEYAELKRRFGWEFNGMRLHEYYFGNIAKSRTLIDENSKLLRKIENDFGSYEEWEMDFKSVGTMRGIGWVVLCYDPVAGRLFNTWINEHDAGHLSGTIPILVMDVFEHAYMIDYGLKRTDYIEAFFKIIDWTTAIDRFDNAIKE